MTQHNKPTIFIIRSGKALLPETFAYEQYLSAKGFTVKIGSENELDESYDILIRFMGFDSPFCARKRNKNHVVVHEYVSLSTPPLAKVKDFMKLHFNKKPAGRIFLNEQVKQRLPFTDEIPWIYREMGVDQMFYQKPSANPEFDLVYAGAERHGLMHEINRLTRLGIKILMIGEFTASFNQYISDKSLVHFAGKVPYRQVPSLYSNCRLGLNFTPDIYPYRIQTSTKTLEYCAAGLGVVSNRYNWVENFARLRNASFLWLEEIESKQIIDQYNYIIPDVSDLEWNQLLDRAGLDSFLISLLK